MSETSQLEEHSSDIQPKVLPSHWETPARYLATALLVLGSTLLLSLLIPIFQTVALAFMFAFVFFLPVQKIVYRFPDRYSQVVIVVYLLSAVLFSLLVYGGFKNFDLGLYNLTEDLNKANASLNSSPGDFSGQLLKNIAATGDTFVAGLKSLFGRLVEGISVTITAFVLSFILLLNLHQARGFLADWIPDRYQAEITQVFLNLDQIWVGYVVANVIYGAAVGLGSYVEYLLLGVPYPFVLAVITGVVTIIPSIGGLLASVIVAVPCLFLGSSVFVDLPTGTFALLVTLVNVAITQASYYFVALPVIGKLSRLPTILVFVGVLAGLVTGNILLAFLSVPILSSILIIGKYLLSKILWLDKIPGQEVLASEEPGFFSQLLLIK